MPPSNNGEHFYVGGAPVHKPSYCAFLDVLGFSERIRESYKLGKHDELLGKFHAILGKAIARLKQDCDGTFLYFKSSPGTDSVSC